mmetsp:Transcript_4908/g.8409  ORF Transcript_4908/g.8409 Transcript_4908/m.8409 type:complete len:258 (+) Transcript_4908:326-1099(+)
MVLWNTLGCGCHLKHVCSVDNFDFHIHTRGTTGGVDRHKGRPVINEWHAPKSTELPLLEVSRLEHRRCTKHLGAGEHHKLYIVQDGKVLHVVAQGVFEAIRQPPQAQHHPGKEKDAAVFHHRVAELPLPAVDVVVVAAGYSEREEMEVEEDGRVHQTHVRERDLQVGVVIQRRELGAQDQNLRSDGLERLEVWEPPASKLIRDRIYGPAQDLAERRPAPKANPLDAVDFCRQKQVIHVVEGIEEVALIIDRPETSVC